MTSLDAQDVDGHRTKRFKHQSYNAQLKDVHLPSALSQSKFDDDTEELSSQFHTSLTHWLQLNLAPSFLSFARKASPLSESLPLLLHHWREVIDLWIEASTDADDEALRGLFDLMQKLAHDLRSTLLPMYDALLEHLLPFMARSISPEALTILLSALSAIFKYLLVPSTSDASAKASADFEILDLTWTRLRGVIGRCNPEVQRAAAEVWALVLRRLRQSARHHCVVLILQDAEEEDGLKWETLEDARAWIFVFAIKSVSQTLHTCAASLLVFILKCHLSPENAHPLKTEKLLRRILTALVHHCPQAEQFEAVSNVLVEEFENVLGELGDKESIRRMLEVVSIPCAVRKGSRVTRKHLLQILTGATRLEPADTIEVPLLNLTVACLVASSSDLSLWLGPGRRIIEHAWASSSEYAIHLAGTLAETEWGGFKQFGLSHVLKNAPFNAEANEERNLILLRLLSKLATEGMLEGVEAQWRVDAACWTRSWLKDFSVSEISVMAMREISLLAPALPPASLVPALVTIADNVLRSQVDPREEYQTTWANGCWVLGVCLSQFGALSRKDYTVTDLKVKEWLKQCIDKCAWSEAVMVGLAKFTKQHCTTLQASILLDDVLMSLKDSLMSHSQALRLSTLQLLTSPLIEFKLYEELLNRCLMAESAPLAVQGVRERVLHIGKVGQLVSDGNEKAAEICGRWLLGQLKVNLRPLWSPVAEALAALSQRFPSVMWELIFHELDSVCRASHAQSELHNQQPCWYNDSRSNPDTGDVIDDRPEEEERTWRDPSAYKLRRAVRKWMITGWARESIIQEQIIRERFDPMNYETQLLATLGACPSLAEKHSRELVPLFLSFASPTLSTKPPKPKLMSWLTLFAKFSNPKALYAASDIHSLYVSLLSHPDRSLQTLSLSCLMSYKSPSLTPYEDQLRALLDDTRWRDEITKLEIDRIETQDRGELVPVMIRLFFGMMLERRGRNKKGDRKAAILSTLAACQMQELDLLVELMLEPISTGLDLDIPENVDWVMGSKLDNVTRKLQLGFLTLLGDVLKNLGTLILRNWPRLLVATLTFTAQSQRALGVSGRSDDDGLEDDIDINEEEIDTHRSVTSLRAIRQLGVKRLVDFFRCPVSFNFDPYIREAFRTIISPRIANLDKENTQGPSALLELFDLWTQERTSAFFLVRYDLRTLPKIYDCLTATNVKPVVLSQIFDMTERLLSLSTPDKEIFQVVVNPHMPVLLSNLATLVQRTAAIGVYHDIGSRQIAILSQIAPYVTDGTQATTLVGLFSTLLRKPHKAVAEKTKVDMLKVVCSLIPLVAELSNRQSSMYSKIYDMFCQLFRILRTRQARVGLTAAFQQLANVNDGLETLADLVGSLNAYSLKRIDEPDFDRRLTAFTTLNDVIYQSLTVHDWTALLPNMLFFIQDETELSIRNNAALSMKRFIEILSTSDPSDFHTCFLRILYPGLKRGLRSRNEMVRAEILSVVAYAVAKCDSIGSLQEMRVLLAAGDEEVNFFNNIHHIQIHRRSRALRRLADHCDDAHFRSNTLADIFVPVVGHFILAASNTDHHLVNEAILTTGRIAKHLSWGAYYSLVQQYLKLSMAKDSVERAYVRTLVAILDNFHFPMEAVVTQQEPPITDESEDDDGEDIVSDKPAVDLKTIARIADAVNERLLPSLLKHLEQRNELEDSIRIPIAIGIAKVAQHLPPTTREPQISRLLTILCQILRSKSQDTRDLTRETLCRIVVSLGSSSLSPLLRELRVALPRGPQLHVLAFVTHALLVFITSPENVQSLGKLDDCVPDIVHVSAEVIFGISGTDVQAEEFKTRMKEVRGSAAKGMDSFAILSKYITPAAMSNLLFPLKAIMQETESVKTMQQVEEVLRRIAGGLNSNAHFGSTEVLALCHTLISQNARFLKEASKPQNKKTRGKNDALVQLKRRITVESDHYVHNSYRFVCFGLDLFNTAYRRGRFDFHDTKIISHLEPMVSVIGNTLYSSEGHVTSLGLKAAANIVKCPLKSIEKSLPVFVRQILNIVKQAGSTESEMVQTAFKSLAVIIRDCPSAQVKEKDLTYLLDLLSPDLEEPTRQAPAFALLRTVISRKFIVPEIYDLMDKVSEIMVTSQSPQVQELCRGVLLQFLLDYPQGKGRLKLHMSFFARNLSYDFESGRKSVMELLSAVISKFQDDLVREYADLLFVALVMVLANDDSSKCREMAAQLIKSLFSRLDDSQRRVVISHVHSWAAQPDNPALARVSSQVYGLILDTIQKDATPYLPGILEDISAKLRSSAQALDSFEVDDIDADTDLGWQTPYQALTVISKVFDLFPDTISQLGIVAWPSVVSLLLYPHAWVRTASCRLLGSLFSVKPVAPPDSQLSDNLPLSFVGMKDIANALCLQLKSEHLENTLGLQIVKNLFYIAKCFCAMPASKRTLEVSTRADGSQSDDEGAAVFDVGLEQQAAHDSKDDNPLAWLFSKLSYQARTAQLARRNKHVKTANWSQQPSAVLRWFAAMASHMDATLLERYLPHILSPVYRITDDDTIHDTQMEELKVLAIELQDLVQSKVGTTKFANVYNRIRQSVLDVRRERKTARVVQATVDPQAAAKRKVQRNVVKKESRKRKNREFADNRTRNTFTKRRKEN